jgi:hypothetical protein
VSPAAEGKGAELTSPIPWPPRVLAYDNERNDNRVDAWWLAAAGLERLGHPPVKLPAAQRAALTAAHWPNISQSFVSVSDRTDTVCDGPDTTKEVNAR